MQRSISVVAYRLRIRSVKDFCWGKHRRQGIENIVSGYARTRLEERGATRAGLQVALEHRSEDFTIGRQLLGSLESMARAR